MSYDFLVRLRADADGIKDLAGNTWNFIDKGNGSLKYDTGKINNYGIHIKNGILYTSNIQDNIGLTEDFTISLWYKPIVSKYDYLIPWNPTIGTYVTGTFSFYDNYQGQSGLMKAGPGFIYATTALVTNSWVHTALTRTDGITYYFQNGCLLWSGATDITIIQNNSLATDCLSRYTVDAIYDDICIIKGKALWTADFTPPTSYLLGRQSVYLSAGGGTFNE